MSISGVHMCRSAYMDAFKTCCVCVHANWIAVVGVSVYAYWVLLILRFLWFWREYGHNVNQTDCTQNFRRASNSLVYIELQTHQQINRANPIYIVYTYIFISFLFRCFRCSFNKSAVLLEWYIFFWHVKRVWCATVDFVARAKRNTKATQFNFCFSRVLLIFSCRYCYWQ